MKQSDIIRVLLALGNARSCIKPSDTWVAAPCPLAPWTHDKGKDKRASFGISVNEDGPSGYNCLSCKEHGNLLSLIDRLADLREVDYSELRAEVEDLEVITTFPPWESRPKPSKQLPEPLDEEYFDSIFPPAFGIIRARQYFHSRRLWTGWMERMDLRWDDYRSRILFKVMQDGILYGMSGRSILPNARNKVKVYNHPSSLFLVGEEYVDLEDKHRPVVVIEGLMGLVELYDCNLSKYADAVALQGSSMSEEQCARLISWGKPVVLLFDPDRAGREGIYGKRLSNGRRKEGALAMLHKLADVRVAEWPEGVDDLSQLTRAELHEMIMNSASFGDLQAG